MDEIKHLGQPEARPEIRKGPKGLGEIELSDMTADELSGLRDQILARQGEEMQNPSGNYDLLAGEKELGEINRILGGLDEKYNVIH